MKSTYCAMTLLTVALSMGLLPVRATSAADSSPVKLYNDESRSLQMGRYVWNDLNRKDGFFQTRVMASASYDLLKQYDVMLIYNQIETISYSQSELEAIRRFVEAGGGLLLLGEPLIPIYAANRRPRRVLFEDAQPLRFNEFSMNQIADMFGVQFSNGSVMGKPSFTQKDPVSAGIDTTLLSFEQSLSPLLCTNERKKTLVYANRKPVAVSLSFGKGRVGVCAAPGLFTKYGRLSDRLHGTTDHIISVQKELLVRWLRWLAENSPARGISPSGYPSSVTPEIKLSGDSAEVYCIPQLREVATDLLVKWELVWEDFSKHTGLESPLTFVPAAKPGDKLQVYLRGAALGGLSGGMRISVPGAGKESDMISVLGHEVGHKMLLGWNIAVSEEMAEWFAIRALRATGYREVAENKMKAFYADFSKADPSHKTIDIANASSGKWIWIMTQLCEKYGDDTIEQYIASIHRNNNMFNQYLKYEGNKRVQLTHKDHIKALCEATGEDLVPWFKSLGTTIE